MISSLKAGGPHAIQGKRAKVKTKTPLTNQAINHLAVSVTVTHSGYVTYRVHFALQIAVLL